MNERGAWRWRMALLVAVAVLLGARYYAARNWMNRKLAIDGGGPPAILQSRSMHHSAIETWDWNTRQFQTLVELDMHPTVDGVLRAGDKVVWLQGGELHSIDLKAPDARRRWKTPFPYADNSVNPHSLVGASVDHRLVVVQFDHLVETQPNTFTMDAVELAVIDIETGEVVSTKHWHSRMSPGLEAGEFESNYIRGTSTDPNEPTMARWRLTERGDWELASATPPNSSMTMAKGPAGRWRRLPAGGKPAQDETSESGFICVRCPEHFVIQTSTFGDRSELLLGHANTDEIQRLGYYSNTSPPSFSDDQKHVIVNDANDDLRVFESATGRLVASDTSGSFWRRFVHGVSAASLCVALGWLVSSWRQGEFRSAMFDLHAAGMAGQLAFFGNLLAYSEAGPRWLMPLGMGAMSAITVVFGMLVGWSWIHGDLPLVARLRQGLLSIAAMGMVPAGMLLVYVPLSMAYVALVPSFGGLFVASLTAMILAPFSMTGWRVNDRPIEARGRGFGLASMMLMVAGTAVVMGFLRLNILPIVPEALLEIVMYVAPAVLLGIVWPAIAMLNMGGPMRISLEVVIVALIPIVMAGRYCVRGWNPWGFDTMPMGFGAVAGVYVLAMVLLLRKWGWRWRKAPAAAIERARLEAAA